MSAAFHGTIVVLICIFYLVRQVALGMKAKGEEAAVKNEPTLAPIQSVPVPATLSAIRLDTKIRRTELPSFAMLKASAKGIDPVTKLEVTTASELAALVAFTTAAFLKDTGEVICLSSWDMLQAIAEFKNPVTGLALDNLPDMKANLAFAMAALEKDLILIQPKVVSPKTKEPVQTHKTSSVTKLKTVAPGSTSSATVEASEQISLPSL